jgi:ribonuclease G
MPKEILVSVETDETRVSLLEDGELSEVYIERPVSQRVAGSIYKGRVENVLPGMQAAFVDIGLERNAFLYVDDALPLGEEEDDAVDDGRRPTIKDLLHEKQEVVVQVAKEPIGSKGARVTRQATLPGRYLVMMPMVDYVGVSRRISDDAERERLRGLANDLRPQGTGLIVRTAAEGRQEADLKRDIEFLTRLWGRVQSRAKVSRAPSLLHRDLGLVFRVVRDSFSDDVQRFVVDNRHEYERILDILDVMDPALKERVSLHAGKRPLFETAGIEEEIDKALKRRIWLKCGGHLVLDQTEALTVIDVNTGKYVGTTNLADTVLKTNLEAAQEIARQLRLRDIGGIIIIDFIDMEVPQHRHRVLEALQEALRLDRTKAHVLGITHLGLVEMTRKKVRQGLDEFLQRPCPYCEGRGRVLSEETMYRKVRREIKRILRSSSGEAILVEVHPSVAALLIGAGGANLREMERETGRTIYVRGSDECHLEDMNLRALGTRDEVAARALPVQPGQVMELRVEEPHVSNLWDGIARVEGYVIDIEGAGKRVGEKVKVEITRAFRTYAKAKIV